MVRVRDAVQAGALGELSGFRQELYGCLSRRADALFELCDSILCSPGPVTSLPELSLAFVHRRGLEKISGAVKSQPGIWNYEALR